ncbi:AAA family ATPase [candidate division GN15 bacterium]|nr:AAA family ATPase [candidate division GN15 bacterium]
MAHVYPQQLVAGFTGADVSSEKLVYDKLAASLDDNWYVFHDLKWDEPKLNRDYPIGQADFVLVHPCYGYLVLEVKGGRCRYHADDRVWETVNRDEVVSEIKDPFEQAAAGARVIHKLLVDSPLGRKMKILRGQSAVLFPDCTIPRQQLRADIQAWRILDQADLFNLSHTIKHLFTAAFPQAELERAEGMQLIAGIRDLWGGRDAEGRSRLDLRLKLTTEKLVVLTERQRSVLRSLSGIKRMCVSGCAGSGKTTLAVHKAKMLAEQGKQVGLFCFNVPLAEHLKRKCEGFDRITAGAIAELFQLWLQQAGVALKRDGSDWWDITLPNLVAENLDRIPCRFDAVVVDEGQDIRENYWTVLELLLRRTDEADFYIFADHGQNIYNGKMTLSFETAPYYLNRNVRNTNQVFDVARKCCNIPTEIESSGVDGPRPRLYAYTDDSDMLNKLETIVDRLVGHAVSPNDIAILGTRSQSRTVLAHGTKLGGLRLVSRVERGIDIVTMTVNRYKGLEAPVVILCEFDDELLSKDSTVFTFQDLLYVGMTRATGQLIVLASGEAFDLLKKAGFRLDELSA